MNIDYYAFVMDKFGQDNYAGLDAKFGSHIFENFEFDLSVAKRLGKLAIYCKEDGKFYDENWQGLDLCGKKVLPRCIIPEINTLYNALEQARAISVTNREDYNKVLNWPKYISPKHHEIVSTTYREFLENFKNYKEKYGRVFFKTKNKNISCEVKDVVCLDNKHLKKANPFRSINNDDDLVLIKSDDDLGGEPVDDFLLDFFKEPMYMVYSGDTRGHNDLRFGFLDKDTEVYVEPFLEIVKDNNYKQIPVEYRSFVVDGKFVTSRSWVPTEYIPEEVIKLTSDIISSVPEDMNKTFVVDVLQFVDADGNQKYDLCEINPLTCSGYEHGSSIFVSENAEGIYYPKYDGLIEEKEQ